MNVLDCPKNASWKRPINVTLYAQIVTENVNIKGELKVLSTVPGAEFKVIAPAGFEILRALATVSNNFRINLVITSGTDGIHSGENDPHHRGEAYDVRSHDLLNKQDVLTAVMEQLGQPSPSSGGYVTAKFFGWIEDLNQPNEHIHVQLRHGQTFP